MKKILLTHTFFLFVLTAFPQGNVGIGTANPVSKLEIEGSAFDWDINTPGKIVGTLHLDPGSSSPNIGNAITFGAHDSGGGDNAQAGIYVRSDGSYGTKMYFATSNSYAAGSKTRMAIDQSGNVGIGTPSPTYNLDVVGTGRYTGQLLIPVTPTANAHAASKKYVDDKVGAVVETDPTWNGLVNTTGDIGRTGSVGIGTLSPSSRLDVHATNDIIANFKRTSSNSVGISLEGSSGAQTRIYGADKALRVFHTPSVGPSSEVFTIETNGNTKVSGSLNIQNGTAVNEFSTDGTLGGNSDNALPTEQAVKTYVDNQVNGADDWDKSGNNIFNNNTGNVGIGINPTSKFEVNGNSKFKTVSQGYSNSERFYPNVVSDHYDGTVNGAWIIHTPINRNSNIMSTIRVHGYGYGNQDVIDFTISVYTYGGATGNIDGGSGAAVSYKLSDNGTDNWEKYVGIDDNGKLAIAFGNTSSSAYYYRLSVDAWVTRSSVDFSSGWSIDRSTTANFGWKDIKGPLTAIWKGTVYINSNENVAIGGVADDNYKLRVYGKLRTNGINETSDIRFKKDIENIDNSLQKVQQLQGVSYYWRTDEFPNQQFTKDQDLGLIAQEVEKILPQVVNTDDLGYKSVQYSHIVPLLIEAIKELSFELEQTKENHVCEVVSIKKEQEDKYDLLNQKLEKYETLMNSLDIEAMKAHFPKEKYTAKK